MWWSRRWRRVAPWAPGPKEWWHRAPGAGQRAGTKPRAALEEAASSGIGHRSARWLGEGTGMFWSGVNKTRWEVLEEDCTDSSRAVRARLHGLLRHHRQPPEPMRCALTGPVG